MEKNKNKRGKEGQRKQHWDEGKSEKRTTIFLLTMISISFFFRPHCKCILISVKILKLIAIKCYRWILYIQITVSTYQKHTYVCILGCLKYKQNTSGFLPLVFEFNFLFSLKIIFSGWFSFGFKKSTNIFTKCFGFCTEKCISLLANEPIGSKHKFYDCEYTNAFMLMLRFSLVLNWPNQRGKKLLIKVLAKCFSKFVCWIIQNWCSVSAIGSNMGAEALSIINNLGFFFLKWNILKSRYSPKAFIFIYLNKCEKKKCFLIFTHLSTITRSAC